MLKSFDKGRKDPIIGLTDLVLYDVSPPMSKNQKSLIRNYIGPFVVIDSMNEGKTVRIRDAEDNSAEAIWTDIYRLKSYDDGVSSPVNVLLQYTTDKISDINRCLMTDSRDATVNDVNEAHLNYLNLRLKQSRLLYAYLLYPSKGDLKIDNVLFTEMIE